MPDTYFGKQGKSWETKEII